MQVIKRLPTQLANQIAAGEVVQRPASVVKELMENSIDAGATEISLTIKDGGRTLISIQDNGSGMNSEDALLCFERHATSKINAINDLFNLNTMGVSRRSVGFHCCGCTCFLKNKKSGRHYGFSY